MTDQRPPLLLHVGYHKTATTWMQGLLFRRMHGYRKVATQAEVFANIVRPHGFRFDPGPMRDLIARKLDGLAPGEVPVISSEVLSGHPFQGGHESDIYAERLHRIAPEARILITIRNQMRILPSVYMQYLQRGGRMPYDRFFAGESRVGYFGFTPEHFEYDLLIAHYQRLFGRENVYVLTQESLVADMEDIAERLAEFAGNMRFEGLEASVQRVYAPSYPEFAAPILRRINHVQRSTLNPTPVLDLGESPDGLYRVVGYLSRSRVVTAVLGNRRPISDFVHRQFGDYYIDSNARLATLPANPLDLSGYP